MPCSSCPPSLPTLLISPRDNAETEQSKNNERIKKIIGIITRITRVVVLLLAYLVSPTLTLAATAVGIAVGAVIRLCKFDFSKSNLSPLCAIGYWGFSTGLEFGAIVSTLLTSAFLCDCIWHGTLLFKGVITGGVGLSLGYDIMSLVV